MLDLIVFDHLSLLRQRPEVFRPSVEIRSEPSVSQSLTAVEQQIRPAWPSRQRHHD
jgi:hypothetical protein